MEVAKCIRCFRDWDEAYEMLRLFQFVNLGGLFMPTIATTMRQQSFPRLISAIPASQSPQI